MSADILIAEASKLSPQERVRIAEALWQSAWDERANSDDQVDFQLTDEQREELDRRLEDLEKNPEEGSDWQEVLARIEKQL